MTNKNKITRCRVCFLGEREREKWERERERKRVFVVPLFYFRYFFFFLSFSLFRCWSLKPNPIGKICCSFLCCVFGWCLCCCLKNADTRRFALDWALDNFRTISAEVGSVRNFRSRSQGEERDVGGRVWRRWFLLRSVYDNCEHYDWVIVAIQ